MEHSGREAIIIPNTHNYEKRVAELPQDKKRLFGQALNAWTETRTPNRREVDAMQRFLCTFFEYDGDALLRSYAESPESFPSHLYTFTPSVAALNSAYCHDYNYRGILYVDDPLSQEKVYVDAPFAFILSHKIGTRWSPISVASFIPDFANERLLVDQLQGGDTHNYWFHKEIRNKARRARMKFSISPEEMLFIAARRVGYESGLSEIGLRKSMANRYYTQVLRRKEPVYDRVANRQGLNGDESDMYHLAPL